MAAAIFAGPVGAGDYAVRAAVQPVAFENGALVPCEQNDANRVGTVYLLPDVSGMQSNNQLVLRPLEDTAKDRPARGEGEDPRTPNNPPAVWASGTWVFEEWLRRGDSECQESNLVWGYIGLDESLHGGAFRISPSTMSTRLSRSAHQLVQGVMSRLWGFVNTASLPDGQLTLDKRDNDKAIAELSAAFPGEIRVNREVRGQATPRQNRKKVLGGAPSVQNNQGTSRTSAELARDLAV
jgi:hypothetical protein